MKNLIDVEAIYEKLPDLIKQKNQGFVAGSFVAAEIFKQLGLNINPIANDLDWFVDQNDIIATNFCGLDVSGYEKAIVHTIEFDTRIFDLDYSELTWDDITEYRVVASRRLDESINIISVNFSVSSWSVLTPRLDRLVGAFDINAIQVGFDVASKKLCGTDQFWKFCKTLQLEITNLFTPSHSLIRYLKKKRELGCYGDDEFNKKIAIAGLAQHPLNAKFGKLTHEKALIELPGLARLGFTIESNTATSGYKFYRLVCDGGGKILTDLYDIFGGVISSVGQSNILTYQNGEKTRYFADLHPKQIWKVSNLVWRGSKKEQDFVRSFYESLERKENRSTFIAATGRVDYVVGQKKRHFKMLDKVHKFKDEHPNLMFWAGVVTKNADELSLVDAFFTSVRNKYGPSGIGIIEGRDFIMSSMPTIEELKSGDFDRIFTNIDSQFVDINEPLVEEIIGSGFAGDIEIIEITTQKELFEEGDFQHHCVGGYGRSIKSGSCRIVSVRAPSRPRITFEITEAPYMDYADHTCFKVVQSKIKFNNEPDFEWLKMAVDGINSIVQNFKLFDYRLLSDEEREIWNKGRYSGAALDYAFRNNVVNVDADDLYDEDEIPF